MSDRDAEEKLRELLLDVQRARTREAEQHGIAEVLLEGLRVLLADQDRDRMFRDLMSALRPALDFDDAGVAELTTSGTLVVTAATSSRLAGTRWEPATLFGRVMGGRPSALFDVGRVEEWKGQPDEVRDGVMSALHVAFSGEHDVAMLICTHADRAHFSKRHLELARRLVLLGSHALHHQEVRRAQRQAQRRMEAVVDNAPIILWALDADQRVQLLVGRSAEVLGEDSVEGQPLADIVEPDSPLLRAVATALRAGTGLVTCEIGERVFESHFARSREGGVVGVSTDVTAQRRAAQIARLNTQLRAARDRALAASRAKSAFLANMSHELRTPLNAIIGYSDALRDELNDADHPRATEDLGRIFRAGHHLLGLIDSVLELSRIEAGRARIALEDVAVDEVVREVVELVEPMARQNGNDLVVELPEVAPVLRSDRVKLRQILLNLLSNASKFTRDGTVRLDVEATEHRVRIAVSDTGPGMTPDQIERIFEPFVQLDPTTTRRFSGTGLGLAIAREFAALIGARIVVNSEVGVGSVFAVEHPSSAPQEARIATEDAVPVEGPGALVLAIDDDPDIHELLRRTLKPRGFRVAAAHGTDAIRHARRVVPDVITLAVSMAGTDGWDVLSELKRDPQLSDVPVVMLTIVDDVARGFQLGAADFLRKPLDREALLLSLQRVVGTGVGHTVLVAEDDEPSRELVARTLRQAGWIVVEAADGQAALDALDEQTPDVVLLDLMMPRMDGFQFLSELRERPGGDGVPVVVLTARDVDAEDLERLASVRGLLRKGAFPLGRLDDLLSRILVPGGG